MTSIEILHLVIALSTLATTLLTLLRACQSYKILNRNKPSPGILPPE